ncbi:MAG: DUF4423 domain-containing protein [Silvanigrellales bacterium]|nr:DUF4423 domain-containing protein [Silvanigrellales bacterium]
MPRTSASFPPHEWQRAFPDPSPQGALSLGGFLNDVLQRRSARNPAYGLRAFARDLMLAPSHLSGVLRGHKRLSPAKAGAVAQRLGLSDSETQDLRALAEKPARNRAGNGPPGRLQRPCVAANANELDAETMRRVSDWEHHALLELAGVAHFNLTEQSGARLLRLSSSRVRGCLERLALAGLARPDGTDAEGRMIYRRSTGFVTTTQNVSSHAIREHQAQLLSKAAVALENVPLAERDCSTIVFCGSISFLEEARSRIRSLRRELCAEFEATPPERLYCLAIQLFPLSENLPPHSEAP